MSFPDLALHVLHETYPFRFSGSMIYITLAGPHDILCVVVSERLPPEEIARNIA